jgi:hypothetical protein
MQGKENKLPRGEAINLLALKDAYKLYDHIELKGNKWVTGHVSF